MLLLKDTSCASNLLLLRNISLLTIGDKIGDPRFCEGDYGDLTLVVFGSIFLEILTYASLIFFFLSE